MIFNVSAFGFIAAIKVRNKAALAKSNIELSTIVGVTLYLPVSSADNLCKHF